MHSPWLCHEDLIYSCAFILDFWLVTNFHKFVIKFAPLEGPNNTGGISAPKIICDNQSIIY